MILIMTHSAARLKTRVAVQDARKLRVLVHGHNLTVVVLGLHEEARKIVMRELV